MPSAESRPSGIVPNEVRRRRSMQHILDIAETRIVRSGYAAATMDRIAADSELTKGAVYFYFSSKESLLEALIDRSEREIFQPALDLLDDTAGSAADRLVAYFNYFGASTDRLGSYLLPVTVSLQLDAIPDNAHERILCLYAKIQARLESVIAEGIATREFASTVPAAEHAAMVIATTDGMLLEWHRRGDRLNGESFLRAGRQSLIGGLLVARLTVGD